jgi:GNAT superfamily N-acetyltransferase
MALVREITPDDWPVLRDIRLTALADAPDAFASNYAREAAYGEADWRRWIARSGTFLGYLPQVSTSEPAGLTGGYAQPSGPAELISMYVRRQARGRGLGEALIAAVAGWARPRNAPSLHLWVNETNKNARLLYERCGFSLTGERQPLPSNPALAEVGMTRPL